MNCPAFEERIALSAGGDLGAKESAELERHLASCAACAAYAEEMRECLGALAAAKGRPIESAAYANVRAGVLRRLQEKPRPGLWWRPVWAAVAAGLLVGVFLLTRPSAPNIPEPAAEPPQAVAEVEPARREPVAPSPAVQRPAPPRQGPGRSVAKRVKVPVAEPVQESAKPEPQQLVIKIITDDPNVVIYWIADEAGD